MMETPGRYLFELRITAPGGETFYDSESVVPQGTSPFTAPLDGLARRSGELASDLYLACSDEPRALEDRSDLHRASQSFHAGTMHVVPGTPSCEPGD